MDGIILQLKGAKKWTIYDPPFALFPRPDHVRRPTSEFLKHAKQNDPQEFVLNAGDMVYIPRGVVHEATTNLSVIDSAVAGESSNEQTGTDTPKENSPSLHLTYGLETATHYTTEVIVDLTHASQIYSYLTNMGIDTASSLHLVSSSRTG